MSIPIHMRNNPQNTGKLEIIDHPFIISYFAKWYKPVLYVEYGVRSGTCLEQVLPYCDKVWGVDIEPYNNANEKLEFFQMDTKNFKKVLEQRKPSIDMAFIDACHQSDRVVADFDDLFPYITENGLVFLHDTYPIDKGYTAPFFCNDCYKTPDMIKDKYDKEIDILTIPIMPGLTVIRKKAKFCPWN